MGSEGEWVVGIDLGTTNSALAMAPVAGEVSLETFPIVQRISENQLAARPTLPSFLYLPGPYEVKEGALELPWSSDLDYIVGYLARDLGSKIPGRVVSSAKSWLAHRRAEPNEAILPWQTVKDGRKVSALEASRRYLVHLRQAWDYEHPRQPLAWQDLVLTVPASFDEIARDLTLEAARRAGLGEVSLLEEPQAAFYTWLWPRRGGWRRELEGVQEILICDIGGGTCDFSALRVGERGLERVAVGEHLMLGGDNLDMALARLAEPRLGAELNLLQWGVLQQQCRQAKEILLGSEPPESYTVVVPGVGSKLMASALQAELTQAEVQSLILDGFFPEVPFQEPITQSRQVGLQEWGLPYASDPVIPHYLADFLRRHQLRPQAVLFNGGACRPPAIKARLVKVLESWLGHSLLLLENEAEDLAVAQGAAAFAWLKRHGQERIRGGIARSYYLGVGSTEALCVIQRNQDESQRCELEGPELQLQVGKPVAFPLLAATDRPQDRPGQVVERELLQPLGSLETVITSQRSQSRLPVRLATQVTEIGTMALWATTLDGAERWSLQLPLRGRRQAAAERVIEGALVEQAKGLIVSVLGTKASKLKADEVRPRALMSHLESILGPRNAWPSQLNRSLWGSFYEWRQKRRSSAESEAAWFNGAGFLLRPGLGMPLDEWRLSEMEKLLPQWLQYSQDERVRKEFWIFWRRVAAGMTGAAQTSLWSTISPRLLPGRRHLKSRLKQILEGEETELKRLLVSLERVPSTEKELLGELLFKNFRLQSEPVWQLARLGARRLLGAGPQHVLDPQLVTPWVERILAGKWNEPRSIGLSLEELARFTNNRALDLPEDLRQRVAQRLGQAGLANAARQVLEVIEEDEDQGSVLLGESLPTGLTLM